MNPLLSNDFSSRKRSLSVWSESEATPPLGAIAAPIAAHAEHRNLVSGAFWQRIPGFSHITEAQFLDHLWQAKHTITKPAGVLEALQGLVSSEFIEDLRQGFEQAPMSVRISPYLLSLIDWNNPYLDPIRIQFLPLASTRMADHPALTLDSLHEQADSPVPGLVHRYADKALFLALDKCPVYCRFCTRSYAVGLDTEKVEKVHLSASNERWSRVFEYLRAAESVEDVVISGGDSYQLRAAQIEEIGNALLAIPHIRRMRFATKGPAVMPQKILTDTAWTDALTGVVERGRKQHKEVVIHTHFNHPNEITHITQQAMNLLFERGITVRNQSVLQRGVNDNADVMTTLIKRLSYINVHPYYVYVHDMVMGTEDLRTSVQTAIDIEKAVRGSTAGFNTPTFVVDAPGGGGKRDAHSFEHYNRTTGVSVFTAPSVKPGKNFLFFDPLHTLSSDIQKAWLDPEQSRTMIEAVSAH